MSPDEAKAVINKAYDLAEERDEMITITEQGLIAAITEALNSERERAAKIVDSWCDETFDVSCIAATIRARKP